MIDMLTATNLVVPWDFSAHATAALEYALSLEPQPAIRVICVLERPDIYSDHWGPEIEADALAKSEATFWASGAKASEKDLQFVAIFGDPADEIVRFAKSIPDSAILMSTHGRTGLRRLVMGSVTERVLHKASQPVILLPNLWFEHHRPV